MKKRNDQTNLLIAGVVALVTVVALVLNSTGGLDGALLFGDKVTEPAEDGCIDSDPGNLFNKKGTVRNGVYLYKDHCDGDNLHQHKCKKAQVTNLRSYNCAKSEDYNRCLDGACV